MQSILDAINEWIKEILIGAINGNLSTMFGDVNEKVGTIAAEVGKTPQGWNASIFSMIQTLSENVIVPIAGLVITYVLCVELISMVTEKNNMHDIDTFMFFKWFFKAFVAVFIVTHTFDITMAVFDMAQHIVSGAAGVIGGSTSIDVAAALSSMQAGLDAMEIPELLLLMLETSLVSLCMKIMSVLITVVLYGRMIEIYLYCSVSPIPFATMTNREWGQIGNNYLKGLFALGFQGFLIMICVGIYAVLVNNMVIADNLHTAIFSIAAYTVLLCFNLLKSGALAKSLFHAHYHTMLSERFPHNPHLSAHIFLTPLRLTFTPQNTVDVPLDNVVLLDLLSPEETAQELVVLFMENLKTDSAERRRVASEAAKKNSVNGMGRSVHKNLL